MIQLIKRDDELNHWDVYVKGIRQYVIRGEKSAYIVSSAKDVELTNVNSVKVAMVYILDKLIEE